MGKKRTILVTTGLPYASGALHLGHILEQIQADIWVRWRRLVGDTVHFICGTDAHGTPIMLKAQNMNMTPEALIALFHEQHQATSAAFHVKFDNYHTTHSPENQQLTEDIFKKLQASGLISTHTIEQAFDPIQNIFLPDRYIKGTCPKCKTQDQYGDSCEVCGATYSLKEVIEPYSILTKAAPVWKHTEHLFFNLPKQEDKLQGWLANNNLAPELKNKLQEWFVAGLKEWDITRDAPYFGIKIPGTTDKYFYVWLDAPIGYIASFLDYCKKASLNFEEYWSPDTDTELVHFIGKDILYFHALFWPAVLMGANLRTPTQIAAHGFVTIQGQKMSKSRGIFVDAQHFLQSTNPEYLRYYFAAKLGPTNEDIDFSFADFTARINSDLIGKLVNIPSRCMGFLHRLNEGKTGATLADPVQFEGFVDLGTALDTLLDGRQYQKAVRLISEHLDHINAYIDQQKPWHLAKTDPAAAITVATQALNLFKVLNVYLSPILPQMTTEAAALLNTTVDYMTRGTPLLNHTIQIYQPLAQRVELETLEALMTNPTPEPTACAIPATATPTATPAVSDEKEKIDMDTFLKVELKVAKILSAEAVEGADKLLCLKLDIGKTDPIQVFAGIKAAYQPEDLVGKHTVVVANLKPRKMRFGVSEGMLIVAGSEKGLYLIEPQAGAEPGMTVK